MHHAKLLCLFAACAATLIIASPAVSEAGLLAQAGLEAPPEADGVAVLTCEQNGDQVKSCYLAPDAATPNCVDDVSAKRFSCRAIAETLCASGGIGAVELKGNATGDRQRINCSGLI